MRIPEEVPAVHVSDHALSDLGIKKYYSIKNADLSLNRNYFFISTGKIKNSRRPIKYLSVSVKHVA